MPAEIRSLKLVMSTAALHNRHRLHGLIGIIAAWLLLLSPVWSPKNSLKIEPKSSVSSTKATRPDSQSDIAAIGGGHGAFARVNDRLSFPFGPGLPLSPGLPKTFDWVATAQLAGQPFPSSYSFRFLQLIFEHQIAINAP